MTLIKKEIDVSKDYELKTDTINYKKSEVKIVKLTRDNVARIEAIIRTDSDYRDSKDITKEIVFDKKGNIKYYGSSSYWLNQLNEIIYSNKKKSSKGYDYNQIIYNLIIAIDNENSTHLNSDKIGRMAVYERILKIKRTKLIDYLKNPGKEYELINIIQTPKYKNEKNHLSFATKFCHYSSLFLFKDQDEEDNFSIYDNVLKKSLPKYIKKYLNKDVNEKEYENNYVIYMKYIDEIRAKATKMYGDKISRNGFDHLLWYYHKGRK